MPVTCQYLLAQRSTQLFSPTFRSPSLYLQAQALQRVDRLSHAQAELQPPDNNSIRCTVLYQHLTT